MMNLNTLIKSLVLIFGTYCVANSYHEADCSTPSEYVMHFLKQSTTLWQGNNWIAELITNKNAHAHTVFGQIRSKKYYGFAARALLNILKIVPASESTAVGYFDIQRENDFVIVKSHIQDIEVINPHRPSKEQLEAMEKNSLQPIIDRQVDYLGECLYTTSVKSTAHGFQAEIQATCTQKYPLNFFLKQFSKTK